MIAVVSYIGDPTMDPRQPSPRTSTQRKERGLNHHIRSPTTRVGQYWGRGISVVGGENVVIERNSIDRRRTVRPIYIARETVT